MDAGPHMQLGVVQTGHLHLVEEDAVAVGQGPTMRRRQLGMELRRLRDAADLTLEDAAKHISRVPSTVSRIETGKATPRPTHLKALLDLYGLEEGPERDALVALGKDAQQRSWWSEYDDVLSPDFERYLGYEVGAASLRVYDNRGVPGLLQTADYARASFRAGRVFNPDELERRVELRLKRQDVLTRQDPLVLWAVLDEAVLRRMVGGPAVMLEQLVHLLAVGEQTNVSIQVIPFSRGAHAGIDGPFTVIEFAEPTDPDVAYVDGTAGNLYMEKVRDLRRHGSIFNNLLSEALTADESASFLLKITDEIKRTEGRRQG
jgi:transcriptional regulator with XRE-family HTH domain